MTKLYTKKYYPSKDLKNIIHIYWILENNTDKTINIPVVPDGCMDIVYENNELLLVGSLDEGIVIPLKANSKVFGIRFRPSLLPQLLSINADKLTNKTLPLKSISEELFSLLNFSEDIIDNKINKLNVIFEKQYYLITLNHTLLKLLDEIILNKGDISIGELSNRYHMNPRKLERTFKNLMGLSPKKFTNIIRFLSIFKYLLKNGFNELSLKALDFGYYDQAHFNKEFKKFSNLTPTDKILSVLYNTTKSV